METPSKTIKIKVKKIKVNLPRVVQRKRLLKKKMNPNYREWT
jgi:hypothetical protein